MIRVLTAAILLRTTGAAVQFVVRRKYNKVGGQGTSVLKTARFKEARAKYHAMRIADVDTITITLEAIVEQRHGTVEAQ
jgi:hypothetical protein